MRKSIAVGLAFMIPGVAGAHGMYIDHAHTITQSLGIGWKGLWFAIVWLNFLLWILVGALAVKWLFERISR